MTVTNWVNETEVLDKYKAGYSQLELANCPYCKHWETKFDPSHAICNQCFIQHPELPSLHRLNKE